MEEFVCADGRMSVNGVCYISKIPDQNNNIIPTKTFDQKFQSIEDIPIQKNNFEWSFDKVGDTVGNFNDTLTENLTSFNSYVSEKLGVENIAKNAAIGLALGPYAVPFRIGKSMFDQFQTNKNTQNYTNTDPQGNIVTYDMMTYDNNQPQDYGQGGASQQTQASYEDSSGSYTGQGEASDWGGGE
tara:strand:+ start:1815 stop:2369 length:555 start_codon:yes stop_codon:yes gene_type:complete